MSPPRDIATKRVLVCDDNGAFRRVICRGLIARGYAVSQANDATEAARLLLEADNPCKAFDVVLMDYRMHFGMTGGEAANLIRTRCPDQPIVYLSGFELPSDLVTHELVLMKPVDMDTLVEALELAIRRKADTEPPSAPEPDAPTVPRNPKPQKPTSE